MIVHLFPILGPRAWCNRRLVMSIAGSAMSIPIQCLFNLWAATMVVPQPQKGSNTVSPFLLLAEMTRSSSASGFWVG